MEYIQFLVNMPLFAGLDMAALSALSRRLRQRSFGKGESLFNKGEFGDSMYLIQSGLVRVFMTGDSAHEITVALLSSGDFLGEMAILDDQPRSASAVAMEDSQTLALSKSDFLREMAENSRIAEAIIRVLVCRLRQADELVENLSFLDVGGRLARCLLHLADIRSTRGPAGIAIEISLTQRDLASLVGATRESVNRAMAQFQEMGVLSVQREHVVILKREALVKHAR